MEQESIKLTKTTLEAIANYLSTKPYSEVVDVMSKILYEANNQQIFNTGTAEKSDTPIV